MSVNTHTLQDRRTIVSYSLYTSLHVCLLEILSCYRRHIYRVIVLLEIYLSCCYRSTGDISIVLSFYLSCCYRSIEISIVLLSLYWIYNDLVSGISFYRVYLSFYRGSIYCSIEDIFTRLSQGYCPICNE